jgi:hypothetical protein
VRTTIVRAARSCQPRPSKSRTSGGTTTAISSVRSTARGTPTTTALSIEATRIPSATLPALAPNTATGTAVIRNQTPRTYQLKVGFASGSGPASSDAMR